MTLRNIYRKMRGLKPVIRVKAWQRRTEPGSLTWVSDEQLSWEIYNRMDEPINVPRGTIMPELGK